MPKNARMPPQILVVGECLGRLGRLAEAARVVANDPVALGEERELLVPLAAVEQVAVQHHQRVASASHLEIKLRAVDLREAAFGCEWFRSYWLLLYSLCRSLDPPVARSIALAIKVADSS